MEVRSLIRVFSRGANLARLTRPRAAWTKRADLFLIGLALLGIVLHLLVEASRMMSPQPHMDQKIAAATRTVRCFEAIRLARLGMPEGHDLENDPASSGLIGQENTLITTDRGVLESKLTSVNPNFAAVMVDYFHRIGLKPGDVIAVALTGSFPAMNIATLVAAEEMGLRPVVITSVGASMWGANDPDFTWLDMEAFLVDRRLLKTRSAAASLGGSNDRGRGLSPRGRLLLREAVERNGVDLISVPTLDESVIRRMETYAREAGSDNIRAFINVGGGAAAIGNRQSARLIRAGVNRTIPRYNWSRWGVAHHMSVLGVPVIHVLNMEAIARRHGMPIAPEAVPPVGEGTIFHREAYDLKVAIPALLLYLVLCFRVLRARQRAVRAARETVSPTVPGMVPEPAGERGRG